MLNSQFYTLFQMNQEPSLQSITNLIVSSIVVLNGPVLCYFDAACYLMWTSTVLLKAVTVPAVAMLLHLP